MAAPVCLIVNPAAGGGKAGRLAPAGRACARAGTAWRSAACDTRDLDHARELAREAAEAGETVVALSGDGMVGVIADALRGVPGAVLGRAARAAAATTSRACSASPRTRRGVRDDRRRAHARDGPRRGAAARSRRAGGTRVRGDRLGGLRQRRQPDRQRGARPGWAGSCMPTARCARSSRWRPARFEIELDPPGERHSFIGYTVAAANSKAYGGGMLARPRRAARRRAARGGRDRARGQAALPGEPARRCSRATHVELRDVRVFRAGEVAISRRPAVHDVRRRRPDRRAAAAGAGARGAVTMLVPATVGGAFAAPSPPLPGREPGAAGARGLRPEEPLAADGGHARSQARARAGRGRALAAARRRRHQRSRAGC